MLFQNKSAPEKCLVSLTIVTYILLFCMAYSGLASLFSVLGIILFSSLLLLQSLFLKKIIHTTSIVMVIGFVLILILNHFLPVDTVFYYSGSIFYTLFLVLFLGSVFIKIPYTLYHLLGEIPKSKKIEASHYWITLLWSLVFVIALGVNLSVQLSMFRLVGPILVLGFGHLLIKMVLPYLFSILKPPIPLEHSEKLSLTQIFEGMEKILDTTLLGYQKCIIQYKIYGQESGTWHFEIYKGEAVLRNFEHENPQLEMCVDYKTWMSIVNGEITGEMAFSQGLIKAEGDFQILIQHDELFNRELLQEIER